MAAATTRGAARRIVRKLAPVLVGAGLAVAACQAPPAAPPAVRAEPRHPIQPSDWDAPPARTPVATSAGDDGRLTPGPNSRIAPTPDMAPRVEPSAPVEPRSSRDDIDRLRRDLREQRNRGRQDPGPPRGTIDLRPGTIHPDRKGTIEVPR